MLIQHYVYIVVIKAQLSGNLHTPWYYMGMVRFAAFYYICLQQD